MKSGVSYYNSNLFLWGMIISLAAVSLVAVPQGLAQDVAAPANNPMAFWTQTMFYLLIGWIVFHLLVLRPTAMKQSEQKKFIEGLKKGDEVLVNESLIAKVVSVKPDLAVVELAQDVKIRVVPAALGPKPAEQAAS